MCGALSCREVPEWVVWHPDYEGGRVLCSEHAQKLVDRPVRQPPAKARGGPERERPEGATSISARSRNVEVGGDVRRCTGRPPAEGAGSDDGGEVSRERSERVQDAHRPGGGR